MATTITMRASAAITNRDCRAVLDAVKALASLDPCRGFDLDRICAQRQICHYVMATKDWRDGCSARLVVGRPARVGTQGIAMPYSHNSGRVQVKDGEPNIALLAFAEQDGCGRSVKDPASNH
jgi:hypothetical protein